LRKKGNGKGEGNRRSLTWFLPLQEGDLERQDLGFEMKGRALNQLVSIEKNRRHSRGAVDDKTKKEPKH